jgi:hypothetical protein
LHEIRGDLRDAGEDGRLYAVVAGRKRLVRPVEALADVSGAPPEAVERGYEPA